MKVNHHQRSEQVRKDSVRAEFAALLPVNGAGQHDWNGLNVSQITYLRNPAAPEIREDEYMKGFFSNLRPNSNW